MKFQAFGWPCTPYSMPPRKRSKKESHMKKKKADYLLAPIKGRKYVEKNFRLFCRKFNIFWITQLHTNADYFARNWRETSDKWIILSEKSKKVLVISYNGYVVRYIKKMVTQDRNFVVQNGQLFWLSFAKLRWPC